MSLKTQFGQRLRTIRNNHDISQETLAQFCDCSVETISHLERGIHGPRFEMLEKLSKALKTPVMEFFRFT